MYVCLDFVNLICDRFFTGHTKNPDGSIQFKPGKTSANDAANGAIKILSNSVCAF